MISILPGLAKGAMQAKLVLPQASVLGYILVLVPALQLPLMATVLCVIIQVAGSWSMAICMWLAMVLLKLPIYAALEATGPHSSAETFKIAHQGLCRCPCGFMLSPGGFKKLIGLGMVIALWGACNNRNLKDALDLDIPDMWGKIGKVIGDFIKTSLPMKAMMFILNFSLAKTFVTVVSADLLLQMLISLEGFALLMPERAMECREKLAAGLLLELHPKEAAEMLAKYDEDGNGEFDEEEITKLMHEVEGEMVAKMAKFEADAAVIIKKRRATFEAKERLKREEITSPEFKAIIKGIKNAETEIEIQEASKVHFTPECESAVQTPGTTAGHHAQGRAAHAHRAAAL
jgi:hypothetical protein